MKEMQPRAIILVGIPCSGKSTFARKKKKEGWTVLSRDEIRENMMPGVYKFSQKGEEMVTVIFDMRLRYAIYDGMNIILDNTHCKQKYIDDALKKFPSIYNVEIKYFDIPLWKATWRNIIRRIKTGKWIPFNVMETMYKNYKKLRINE